MMCVPFVWMNMRMETSSESFHVLMVSSCILGLVFVFDIFSHHSEYLLLDYKIYFC